MIVVVTGTGTDIGKTWFAAATIAALRGAGVTVVARKPVQSFAPDDTGPTDADVLARATGEAPHTVCPPHRWLPMAVAPPMAAVALGLAPFTIAELAAQVRATVAETKTEPTVVIVEGAGGVRSPIADDGDTAARAALTADRIVVVADAGLGTINSVRLTVAALTNWTPVIALNRYDDTDSLHRANRDWLVDRDGLRVVTTPTELAEELRYPGGRRDRS